MNLAVASQILDNIKNGQLRSCLAMGFEEKDLKTLIDPRSMGTLVNSPVPWFKVAVDGTVVHRLLAHACHRGDECESGPVKSPWRSSPPFLDEGCRIFPLEHRGLCEASRVCHFLCTFRLTRLGPTLDRKIQLDVILFSSGTPRPKGHKRKGETEGAKGSKTKGKGLTRKRSSVH
ncbi:STY4526/YPO1902 family pathogenicity island replication protein [Pseudomonas batumici]